jgi:FMN-dependent NADH-azoreductase
MATLLHINGHPGPAGSTTLRISDAFVARYREVNPGDTVVTADLYHEEVPFLAATHLSAVAKQGREALSPDEQAAWGEIQARLDQLCGADKYLVTAPMWNFGVPAILKAYVDLVVQAGYTFRFTGPGASQGLLDGRPLAIVSTRGGNYDTPPMSRYEMCVRYLEHIFGFMGVEVTAVIIAEGMALVAPHEREEIIQDAIVHAQRAAESFDQPRQLKRAA